MRSCCCVILSICLLFVVGCSRQTDASLTGGYVLIDPGHGGFDGGAVAKDGTLEKHINLEISLCLRDMLQICGVPVEMTRTVDTALMDSEDDSIRNKKVSDMRQRLVMYNNAETVISIHQNHFLNSKYSGTQVFYSPNHNDGARLAQSIQNTVVGRLQPDNKREIKSVTDGIYLMHHSQVPSVLVECGFLSNPDELSQLKNPDYRQRLAWAVMLGYWNYRMCEE